MLIIGISIAVLAILAVGIIIYEDNKVYSGYYATDKDKQIIDLIASLFDTPRSRWLNISYSNTERFAHPSTTIAFCSSSHLKFDFLYFYDGERYARLSELLSYGGYRYAEVQLKPIIEIWSLRGDEQKLDVNQQLFLKRVKIKE